VWEEVRPAGARGVPDRAGSAWHTCARVNVCVRACVHACVRACVCGARQRGRPLLGLHAWALLPHAAVSRMSLPLGLPAAWPSRARCPEPAPLLALTPAIAPLLHRGPMPASATRGCASTMCWSPQVRGIGMLCVFVCVCVCVCARDACSLRPKTAPMSRLPVCLCSYWRSASACQQGVSTALDSLHPPASPPKCGWTPSALTTPAGLLQRVVACEIVQDVPPKVG